VQEPSHHLARHELRWWQRQGDLDTLVFGEREALVSERHQRVGAYPADRAVLVDVLRQPQLDLVRRSRQRMGADVRVNDEQVDRVGTHVDHAQSHAVNLPKWVHADAHVPHSLGGCQKPLLISPACGWSSSTPAIPTSASGAT